MLFFLLLSKYEIEATLSAAICRVGFFTPWGKEIDTMRYWQSRGAARNNEMGKEGNKRSRRFLTCNSFDDDGGGSAVEETAYETEREPHGNHFPSLGSCSLG